MNTSWWKRKTRMCHVTDFLFITSQISIEWDLLIVGVGSTWVFVPYSLCIAFRHMWKLKNIQRHSGQFKCSSATLLATLLFSYSCTNCDINIRQKTFNHVSHIGLSLVLSVSVWLSVDEHEWLVFSVTFVRNA